MTAREMRKPYNIFSAKRPTPLKKPTGGGNSAKPAFLKGWVVRKQLRTGHLHKILFSQISLRKECGSPRKGRGGARHSPAPSHPGETSPTLHQQDLY